MSDGTTLNFVTSHKVKNWGAIIYPFHCALSAHRTVQVTDSD